MRVLWLASWYPSKVSPFNGDFIKRHAEAVSMYVPVHLLHIVRDEKGSITSDIFVDNKTLESFKETIVYYYSKRTGIRLVDQILSAVKFRRLLLKFSEDIMMAERPDILHVNVSLNTGIIASFLKKKFKIPYIVTEHWTGLLEEAIDNFSNLSFLKRNLWRSVILNADCLTAVSTHLGQALQKRFSIDPVLIPNVVNTKIFKPNSLNEHHLLRFIYISNFDTFKNSDFILGAFRDFVKLNMHARLTIFTPKPHLVIKKCRLLGIEGNVDCYNEIPQEQLVKYIQQSDALILYSSYETFGCVVIEANACGVPVIVSDIPVMRELVTDGFNGILAETGSSESLCLAMERFVKQRYFFRKFEIAETTAHRFNYSKVGKQFYELYCKIIASKEQSKFSA